MLGPGHYWRGRRDCGTGIPDGVVRLVTLSTALDNMHNRVSAMPWLFERKPQYRSYKLIVTD